MNTLTSILIVLGAFFAGGCLGFLATLALALVNRDKSYGLDEGHMVGAVLIAIITGVAAAAFMAGRLW